MAPAWHAGVSFKLEEGYMEEEEGALAEAVAAEATEQEVQEEETVAEGGRDSDEDYSFDEDDDDEDGTTTVMPASRSELAAARLEISKLQEELGEQKALNSGLRGELRKFTALAARLTAQLQPDKAGTAQAAAGAATATVVSVASSECDAPVHAAMAQAAGPAPADVCSMNTSHMESPGTPAGAGPEAAAGAGEESGLKPWNRLALYREFLASSADLACGTMKEELLAAQEVLHGKAEFEPSSEQLFLSQLQKVLAMGANAARLLSLQQQELE
ncbi:hypothetical protein QJQ45_004474 [Haematococcus lacustris]|nr:hypothetical protein QJQ45_004474 [Haematococcus lacustris]